MILVLYGASMHRICWIPSIRPWVFWCSAVFRRCSSSVGLQLSTLCVHSDAAWCSGSQHRGGRFRPTQSDAPSAHATVQQTGHRHRRAQHPPLSDAHSHCTAAGEPYNTPSTHCRYPELNTYQNLELLGLFFSSYEVCRLQWWYPGCEVPGEGWHTHSCGH